MRILGTVVISVTECQQHDPGDPTNTAADILAPLVGGRSSNMIVTAHSDRYVPSPDHWHPPLEKQHLNAEAGVPLASIVNSIKGVRDGQDQSLQQTETFQGSRQNRSSALIKRKV
jgi:hypothetical protein